MQPQSSARNKMWMQIFISESPDAKRNFCNKLATEAVLEAVEDFFAAVADDFAQPCITVDVHEERALFQTHRLSVHADDRVNQMIPNLHHFGLGAAAVHADVFQDLWHDASGGFGGGGAGFFQRGEVHAAPRGQ